MFNNNYSYTEDHEDPYFVGQESWEAFLKSETANLSSLAPPAPGVSEIMYEKPEEVPERMVEEENYVPYDEQAYLRNFADEFDWSKMKRNSSYKLQIDHDNNVFENERSECTRQNTEAEQEEEETYSISTRESAADRFADRFDGFDNDSQSVYTTANDDNLFDDAALENPEVELEKKVINVLRERPEEERAYIEQILPILLTAVKEMFVNHPIPLTNEMVATIVKELLYNKEAMISAERQVLNEIVQEEVEDMRYERPDKMVTEDELNATNRKEKKATKGNRNNSSMNHLNENYVSNIFQFAKRNYPDDKEIQRIGNERNVSAANFRRLTGSRLTDGILTRKAKARIAASGKELVGNVEYWMRDGYFDQCSEREKYIYHKEKALRDLALSGKYCKKK